MLIDALIILAYFAVIVFIGLYAGRREGSLKDFALGGRRVPWWAVMASIIAAETSAATFLGTPGEGFDSRTFAYVQLVIGVILGRIFVGYIFLKPYYRYKVYTVYDYLGLRFGPISKNYVSALFLFMRTLASGTRMFVPSLVVVLAWQLLRSGQDNIHFTTVSNVWLYVIAISVLTLLTCIYTAVGGIKAVIWTDLIQATLMFGSALVAIVSLLYHIAGNQWHFANAFHVVGRIAPQLKHIDGYFMTGFEPQAISKFKADNHVAVMTAWQYFLMVLANPYTLFSAVVASTLANMAAFGTDQDMVQRLLTAETYKKSRRSLIMAALMDLPIGMAFTFIGILLFVYYKQDPTFMPLDAKGHAVNSDVFGSYILNVMPIGIRGLVLAGVFATAMGSLSTALNALATSATNDWYIPYFARRRSEHHHVAAARWFTALFAVFMIVIASAFAYAKVTNPDVRIIPVVLGIAGFILGPMLGIFLLGMLTRRRGSDGGNALAISLGLIATVIAGDIHVYAANLIAPMFGSHATYVHPKWLPTVSFTWYTLVGTVVVFIVGALFKTPAEQIEIADRAADRATGDDRPIALRQ